MVSGAKARLSFIAHGAAAYASDRPRGFVGRLGRQSVTLIAKLRSGFLDLPQHWEPQPSQIILKKRDEGEYGQKMDPATTQRLEDFF